MRTLRFASSLLQNKRKMSSQSNTLPDENSLICRLIAAKKQRKNVFTVKHLARWELSGSQVDCGKKNNGKMSSQSNTSPDENSLVRTYIQTSRAEQCPGHAVQYKHLPRWKLNQRPAMWVCLPKSLSLMWEGTPGEDICAHLGPVLMPFPTKLFAWVPVYPLYQARPGRIFIHPRRPTRWGHTSSRRQPTQDLAGPMSRKSKPCEGEDSVVGRPQSCSAELKFPELHGVVEDDAIGLGSRVQEPHCLTHTISRRSPYVQYVNSSEAFSGSRHAKNACRRSSTIANYTERQTTSACFFPMFS